MEILWDIRSQLWLLVRSLLQIIDWLGKAFNFLVGADIADPSGNGGTGSTANNLFESIFAGGDGKWSMTDIYFHILFFSILLMGLCIGIGVIKAQFTKDATDSLNSLAGKSLFALIKMLAIPVIFLIALQAIGYIFNYLIQLMVKATGAGNSSIAQMLCDACIMKENVVIEFNQDFDKGQITFENFNFVLCILASAFLVLTLVTVSINLVKRIIEVFFYYLTAPVALAKTPLDDGKSFDLWKENVVSKLFSAGGIIVCMYLYYMITPIFTDVVQTWVVSGGSSEALDVADRGIVGGVLTILFIIGGSTVPANASMMVAQLISQGAGQNESNNVMHTQQMITPVAQLAGAAMMKGAGAIIGGAAKGALGLNGGEAGLSGAATGALSALGKGGNTAAATLGASAATGAAQTVSNAGAAVANAAGGAKRQSGFKRRVSQSVQTAKNKMERASNQGGVVNKTTAALGAAAGVTAGVTRAAIVGVAAGGAKVVGKGFKAVGKGAKKLAYRIGGGDAGAVKRANNKQVKTERKAQRKALKDSSKEERRNFKENLKADTDLSTLRGSMTVDAGNSTTNNTQTFLDNKTNTLEKKFDAVESYLRNDKKAQNWSSEQKQKYREARYGREASEYVNFKPQLQNSGVDMNRYNNMFSKLQASLSNKNGTPKPGADANTDGGNNA